MADFSSIRSSTKLVGSDSSKSSHSDSSEENSSLLIEGVHSALYSGVQSPIDGVAQLVDKTTGTNLMPKLHIIDAPSHAEFGSAKWHAQTIGGALGMIAPFMVARGGSKAVLGRAGLAYEASSLVAPTANMITKARQFAVLESATAGFVFDSVMRPVADNEGNFWAARIKHGTVGALTFGGLTASSIGFKSAASSLLKEGAVKNVLESNISNAVVSGVPAGVINAEANSLLFQGKLATGRELGESVYTMSVAGGALSALHAIPGHEKSTVERAVERGAAPGLSANEFIGGRPVRQPGSSLATKMSELIGSGQTGQRSLNTTIADGFRNALNRADEFMASINPLIAGQNQPAFAMADAYGGRSQYGGRATDYTRGGRSQDFGGRVLMSSMLNENGGTGIKGASKTEVGGTASSSEADVFAPLKKPQVDLATTGNGAGTRRGRTFVNEEAEKVKDRNRRDREEAERAEAVEPVKAWKVFESEGHPEIAEYIRNNPKLRNLKVREEPLSRTGNDHPLVLEVLPCKEFPDGAAMKFAIPEGGWNNEWGTRSYDAELLGKVREVDLNGGSGTGYLYFQELVDVSSRVDSEKLGPFLAKIEKDGKSFEDPGGNGASGQVGVSRKTGKLVLIDYMAVGEKGSQRTLQEIIYGQQMIDEEYDAENTAIREGKVETEQPRDDMQVKSAAKGDLSPESLNPFQKDVLEQLTSGISAKEVIEFATLMDQGKTNPSIIKKEVQRIHALAKKQGLID